MVKGIRSSFIGRSSNHYHLLLTFSGNNLVIWEKTKSQKDTVCHKWFYFMFETIYTMIDSCNLWMGKCVINRFSTFRGQERTCGKMLDGVEIIIT